MATTGTDRAPLRSGTSTRWPTLYECEPTGVGGAPEANGIVYHFCSVACRDLFHATEYGEQSDIDTAVGREETCLEGEVCTTCGADLPPLAAVRSRHAGEEEDGDDDDDNG